ncbi:DUF3883 domain-containing protein [Streptomyces sp. NPDC048606]|uniref:DUF3883 domain-containing protein n=1 Tax=Streptomyces sp. NPDC048606 TaxID=3154726 RepID=UPI00344156AC
MNTTEQIALDLAIRYERSQGRQVTYVGEGAPPGFLPAVMAWARARHTDVPGRPGCDLVSQDDAGDFERLIEVKGRGKATSVSIVDRQRDAMNALGPDWWLYVAVDCATEPRLVVVREPRRLPWELRTPAAELPAGQYRRVGQEAVWDVSPSVILEAGLVVEVPAP